MLRGADLARYCAAEDDASQDIDLGAIPGERFDLRPVLLEASLFEAREIMLNEGVEALFVRRPLAPLTFRTFGVLLRADIDAQLRVPRR